MDSRKIKRNLAFLGMGASLAVAAGVLAAHSVVKPAKPTVVLTKAVDVSTPLQARVTNLPNDGRKYYSLFFLTRDWRAHSEQARMVAMFHQDPRLKDLVTKKTQLWVVYPDDPMYTRVNPVTGTSFRQVTGGVFPSFVLQTPNAERAFKVSGRHLPGSGSELADEIQAQLDRSRPTVTTASMHGPIRRWLKPKPCPNTPQPVDADPLDMADDALPAMADTVSTAVGMVQHVDDNIVFAIAGTALVMALLLAGLALPLAFGGQFAKRHHLTL